MLIQRARSRTAGLVAAGSFLTCLPLPASRADSRDLSGALPYFPLVGLAIGGVQVTVDLLLRPVIARPLVDFVLVALPILLTGGLHLDGLIDAADGLLGPGSPEERLAAMRQSWAGPRGAAAGLGQLLLQFAALSALPDALRGAVLALAPVLGRWAIVYGYVAFPYARRGPSLSQTLKAGATPVVGLGTTAFALGAASLLCWPAGPLLLGIAWLLAEGLGRLAQRRLGGMSGDVYGATEQLVESLTLLLLPVASGALGAATLAGGSAR